VGSKQVRPKRTLLLVFLSETEKIHFLGGLVCLVAEDSALEEAKYRAWGHELQEKVPSFNMHVTDANMHVTVPTCDFAKITCQHLWQSFA
jgi:hypothetical protein